MEDEVQGSTPLLLNVKQVAQRLGVSKRTVWRIVAVGRLQQPVAIGRCKRWYQRDVDAFAEALSNKCRRPSKI